MTDDAWGADQPLPARRGADVIGLIHALPDVGKVLHGRASQAGEVARTIGERAAKVKLRGGSKAPPHPRVTGR